MISAADFSAVFPSRSKAKQITYRGPEQSRDLSSDCLTRWEDDGGVPASASQGRQPKKTSSDSGEGGAIQPR